MRKRIFISHSFENKEIAEQFCAFLAHLGINNDRIFCSSIIGKGINNGEKLNEAISSTIKNSKVIVYLISQSFINSSYCMEELGVGWYLELNKKITCYYLVLPDIELSELQGFVNSKINKFSFITQSDLGLFAENISKRFFIRKPSFSQVSNSINTFLSAVKQESAELVKKRDREKLIIREKLEKEQKLEGSLKEKDEVIQKYRDDKKASVDEERRFELRTELKTIESRFFYLGFNNGISKSNYSSFSKSFWFDMVNRYLEILQQLNITENSSYMELLLSTIYAADGNAASAYKHFISYVHLYSGPISIHNFDNLFVCYNGSMKELIEILNIRIDTEKEGIVKDSYIETVEKLKRRETGLNKHVDESPNI